jgi:hypothetical protein
VSFAAITLCVASQRVFIVVANISLSTQSGNIWIHARIVHYECPLPYPQLPVQRVPETPSVIGKSPSFGADVIEAEAQHLLPQHAVFWVP